jgi:predicted ArsR family transcriptional regulator
VVLVIDRLAAVADPDLRETLLFARGEAGPFTADTAAAALELHRNVARARLDRLAEAGLLDVSFERRSGRSGPGAGRPAKVYRVAPETDAIEFPPRRFAALVGRLVDELPARGRNAALRRVGADFGRELAEAARLRPATRVETGLERLCAGMRSLGFQASLEEVHGDTAVIATPTCPLRPLVTGRPDAAAIDRGMWAGLVERSLRGARAERVACDTVDCLDGHASCSVELRLRISSRARPAPPKAGRPGPPG